MGKPKSKKSSVRPAKNIALDKQITDGKVKKDKGKKNFGLRAEEQDVIDSRTSGKIVKLAKNQQRELETEDEYPSFGGGVKGRGTVKFNLGNSDINVDDENKDVSENDFYEELNINADDAAAFERFQNPKGGKRKHDIGEEILKKIQEKSADIHTQLSDAGTLKLEDIDPRVKELYEGVGEVMKRYRSGKVPKAFKIIPKLRNWEQVLCLTEPQSWSAAAMFQGTR